MVDLDSNFQNETVQNKIKRKRSDGIQVSVDSADSGEEELDYEDDVVDPDDENGSINDPLETECNRDDSEDMNLTETGKDDRDETILGLGATSSSLTDEELIMNNPHIRKLFNKMLDERIKSAQINGESSGLELLSKMSPEVNQSTGMQKNQKTPTQNRTPIQKN